MLDRREFLSAMGSSTAAVAAGAGMAMVFNEKSWANTLAGWAGDDRTLDEQARDEDFWFQVGECFTVDRSVINLNNGGVCPAPIMVQEAVKRHLDYSYTLPAYVLWDVLQPQKEGVRERLAQVFGGDKEEYAITRNASESIETCQLGFDLQRGDEVLTTTLDYPRMMTTFKYMERRFGVVLKTFKIPIPAEDNDQVVGLFEQNITPKTKMILVCHMVNINGQVLPIKPIAALGRKHGVHVIVDGAHSLAHLDFKIPDLDCDYYTSSLHKWLFAPHGTGLLYVKKEKIAGLWPLMAAPESLDSDIKKFEEIGTHPLAPYLAIGEALNFYQGMGATRKLARLVYLRDYWARALLAESDRIRIHTSLKPGFAGGIATVQIDGIDTQKLRDWLWKTHKVFTTPIIHDEFNGLRITPCVYTQLSELDRFIDKMKIALRDGIPA